MLTAGPEKSFSMDTMTKKIGFHKLNFLIIAMPYRSLNDVGSGWDLSILNGLVVGVVMGNWTRTCCWCTANSILGYMSDSYDLRKRSVSRLWRYSNSLSTLINKDLCDMLCRAICCVVSEPPAQTLSASQMLEIKQADLRSFCDWRPMRN